MQVIEDSYTFSGATSYMALEKAVLNQGSEDLANGKTGQDTDTWLLL